MSYDPRLAGGPYGRLENGRDENDATSRKGSVRAARERLAAAHMQGQLPDRSRIVGLPQRPNQLVSQYSVQNNLRPQQELTPPSSSGKANDIYSPTPQWPLSNDNEDGLDSRLDQFPRTPERGPPPQRPPRPTSDELPLQQPSPHGDTRASYQSDDMLSPTEGTISSRPLTTSSAASTASSLGSIPDFPVPQPPMPTIQSTARRNASLGPPPSARRGPSSYYTQMSYVSPIYEESETRSDTIRSHHGSFASSNVIPTNGEDFYIEDDDGMLSDEDATVTSDYSSYERESRASDHDDRSNLVRQASLGRRTKPSLMTIRSETSLKNEDKAGSVKRKPMPAGVGPSAVVGTSIIGVAALASREKGSPGPPSSSLSSGTGLIDPSSGSSSESLNSLKKPKAAYIARPFEGNGSRAIDLEEELESPIHPLQTGTRQAATLAERVGSRRPPRINVDAVREAEARGSLTSLPELIRRATRLAANLDRGRTASRLGMDFWEAGAPEKGKVDSRRSGSLSDMLAAFPPPGEATPTGDRTPNKRVSRWPAGAGFPDNGSRGSGDAKSQNRRRRCCGLPVWTFVTLLIVLLFLIAAAVVIPVVLIAIPKMRGNDANAASNGGNNNGGSGGGNSGTTNSSPPAAVPTGGGQNDKCMGIITCQNGGVAIPNADRSCSCVCINGFTGKTCASNADAGCTTTDLAGTAKNATLGSGIPRLLESAQKNFSVPLDSPRLLSVFSNLGLSCTSENALVTFNGLASRSVQLAEPQILGNNALAPTRSLPDLDIPHPDPILRKLEQRQAIGDSGGVFDATAATPASGSASSSSPKTSSTSSQPISSNTTAIDFARIGVLLVLQESRKLDSAADAQEALQNFLDNDRKSKDDNDNGNHNNGNTVNLGNGFTINLSDFTIDLGNGTTLSAGLTSST